MTPVCRHMTMSCVCGGGAGPVVARIVYLGLEAHVVCSASPPSSLPPPAWPPWPTRLHGCMPCHLLARRALPRAPLRMTWQVTRLTRAEWTVVRAVMGRPRRLSTSFLGQERKKLSRYRADIRLVQQGKPPSHSMKDGPFVYQVPQALAVGQIVTGERGVALLG